MANKGLGNLIFIFFETHLKAERGLSPHTISSYSICASLLFEFACQHHGITIDRLEVEHFDQDLILKFLSHLEGQRHNSPQTRNTRLAAIRTLFRFIATHIPKWKELCEQICAINFKKTTHAPPVCLSSAEVQAFLNAPNPQTLLGSRDRAFFTILYTTGIRAQELVDLKVQDLQLHPSPKIRILGKGKKIRELPLTEQAVEAINAYLKQREGAGIDHIRLFLNKRHQAITRFGVRYIVQAYHKRLLTICPSLEGKKISPHSFRHTTALHLLAAGVNLCVIKEWLGHANINTTHHYMEINMVMKIAALDDMCPQSNSQALPQWKKPGMAQYLKSLQRVA